MLEAKNVVKTFDGFRALDGVSMTVPQGRYTAWWAPTARKIHHHPALHRHIPARQRRNHPGRPADIRKSRGEGPHGGDTRRLVLLPPGEHPGDGLAVCRDPPFFSWDRYHKLREVFPLSEKQPLRRMSKGMQKQAAFWLTMSCMPEVLVLDEPVDGLDPVMRRQVWSLLLGTWPTGAPRCWCPATTSGSWRTCATMWGF